MWYHRSSTARSFTSWLTPALVVIPLVFLVRPGVRSLVSPPVCAVRHRRRRRPSCPGGVRRPASDRAAQMPISKSIGSIRRRRHSQAISTWSRDTTTVSDRAVDRSPSDSFWPVSGRDRCNRVGSSGARFSRLGFVAHHQGARPISRRLYPDLVPHGGAGGQVAGFRRHVVGRVCPHDPARYVRDSSSDADQGFRPRECRHRERQARMCQLQGRKTAAAGGRSARVRQRRRSS